jgi:hypothetical protein
VVEVVVALAQRHQCRDPVVARGVAVIEGLVTEPVGERVDTKRRLLYKGGTENTSVDETADWGLRCQQEVISISGEKHLHQSPHPKPQTRVGKIKAMKRTHF